MGNSLPCLALDSNLPKASKDTKQKLLRRLKELKKPKASTERSKGGKKAVIRVKVVLTRKEAAQLLSACAQGDKNMAQIISKVKRMEPSHLNKVSFVSSHGGWRPALESIPEEV